jgi:lipoate-protein ligase B
MANSSANKSNPKQVCNWSYLGRISYQDAWNIQNILVKARQESRITDSLLLLEHPPTYTIGRRTNISHLLMPKDKLCELGAEVIDVDRGGMATYHGPGQLVGYPIINLYNVGGPLKYIRALESILITTLTHFGLNASRIEGRTGVWVLDEKIAAIGVRISRGVTSHGFALNVNTDLSWFKHIVPCGIEDKNITSMEHLLGHQVPLEEIAQVVADQFGLATGRIINSTSPKMFYQMEQENKVTHISNT